MASSQVEIVSSSPFGCVLRNHGRNRNERCRESNVRAVQAVFEKNLKDLVRDHIHGCISISSHENSQVQISRVASWVSNEQANGTRHKLRLLSKSQNNDNGVKNEEPLPMTPRQSRVLDRWVTRQAQDVKASTMEKHVNEAEPLLVPSNSNTASSTSSMASASNTKNVQNPSTQSENSSASHNLGASSLVQIWEARLNRSSSINSNHNQSQSMGANSGLNCNENNISTVVEEPSRYDSFDAKSDNGTKNEDSFIDWESQSDRTALSEPPSRIRITFDARERERLRVADIIKRLTNGSEDGNDYEQSNNVTDLPSRERKHHTSISEQAEQRCFSQLVNSPRLRGRQAFNDLLMQIERDKNKELDSLVERQAVSKFSQRGRLQSMLRLRCLQRSLAIQDKCHPKSSGAQVNRLPQGSTILHLREKFSTGTGHLTTSPNDSATSRCLQKEVPNNSKQLDKTSTSKIHNEDTSKQNVSSSAEHQGTVPDNCMASNRNEDIHEQTKQTSDDALQQKTCVEVRYTETLKTIEATTSLEDQPKNEMEKEEGANSQHLSLNSQEIVETESSLNVYTQNEIAEQQDNREGHLCPDLREGTETTSVNSCVENEIAQEQDIDSDQRHLYLDSQSQEIAETATSYNDGDENETAEELDEQYQQYFAQRYDWFSNISRPRSYWEGLRQAWYQEVLNTTSEDEEIRQLLERGRVTTFLASDFRDKMDRLMTSRVQKQADQYENQEDMEDDGDRMVQVMCYLHRHLYVGGQGEEQDEKGGVQEVDGQEDEEAEEEVYEQEDDDDDEEEEEEEEEKSLISHQYHEANSYFNQSTPSIQMPSPSVIRSWSFQDENEIGDNSDHTASTYSPPAATPSPAPYYQDTSSITRPSLEMELICNLRGHIEQLHQEMAELRKTVMSCMNMQMKMQQQSFNWEIHSVGREGKNSRDRAPWKRNCCICNEMPVDSLLYRCGHMCTCMKCAQELQWSSGKCPICGLPILDVVRASIPDK